MRNKDVLYVSTAPLSDLQRFVSILSSMAFTFIGLGLMVMLYPNFRVGGFLFVLGVGFLVNSLLFEHAPPDPPRTT